ncbi:Cold shock protein 1 [compost metagenome]
MLGVVKWFLESNEYGYISSDDGDEYFAPIENVKDRTALKEGDRVSFDGVTEDDHPFAINIEYIKL